MSLSEKLLEYFSESTEFVSGEELAKMNNVSRNAVWKAVKQLKSSGYDIISGNKLCAFGKIFKQLFT